MNDIIPNIIRYSPLRKGLMLVSKIWLDLIITRFNNDFWYLFQESNIDEIIPKYIVNVKIISHITPTGGNFFENNVSSINDNIFNKNDWSLIRMIKISSCLHYIFCSEYCENLIITCGKEHIHLIESHPNSSFKNLKKLVYETFKIKPPTFYELNGLLYRILEEGTKLTHLEISNSIRVSTITEYGFSFLGTNGTMSYYYR